MASDPTDPALMTPAARLVELASILAVGVRRLRQRAAIPVSSPGEPASSRQICLAGCPEGRPDGPCG